MGIGTLFFKNMPEAKVEQIIDNSEVAYSSWHDEINTDIDCNYYINGKKCCAVWY